MTSPIENGRQLVLVADDEQGVRELVAHTLDDAGFEVLAAADGSQALELAIERRPELAVLDVRMPGLTGLEVTRRLRENDATAQMPVILLTAAAQMEDVTRGFEAGAHGYIEKPFSPWELVARVQTLIAQAE